MRAEGRQLVEGQRLRVVENRATGGLRCNDSRPVVVGMVGLVENSKSGVSRQRSLRMGRSTGEESFELVDSGGRAVVEVDGVLGVH